MAPIETNPSGKYEYICMTWQSRLGHFKKRDADGLFVPCFAVPNWLLSTLIRGKTSRVNKQAHEHNTPDKIRRTGVEFHVFEPDKVI